MDEIDDLELAGLDPRRLTQEQQSELRQHLLRRAQAARGQALRDIARGVARMLWTAPRASQDLLRVLAERVVGAGRRWWNAWMLRRQRRAAIRELHALDDRMLRDIGLGRSEIESIVGDVERLMVREFTPVRPFPRPAPSRAAGKCRQGSRPTTGRPLGKSAA
jgi:uncharacterized protein YjiS (DUF1127 family)